MKKQDIYHQIYFIPFINGSYNIQNAVETSISFVSSHDANLYVEYMNKQQKEKKYFMRVKFLNVYSSIDEVFNPTSIEEQEENEK